MVSETRSALENISEQFHNISFLTNDTHYMIPGSKGHVYHAYKKLSNW
jgi:hypothetical protein